MAAYHYGREINWGTLQEYEQRLANDAVELRGRLVSVAPIEVNLARASDLAQGMPVDVSDCWNGLWPLFIAAPYPPRPSTMKALLELSKTLVDADFQSRKR